jgi:hypothetical protein
MIALYIFLSTVFGALVGFTAAALFSARAYDKGYNDAKEGR